MRAVVTRVAFSHVELDYVILFFLLLPRRAIEGVVNWSEGLIDFEM